MATNNLIESKLTLGWKVTNAWEPLFWLNPKAKVGMQNENDLVQVPSNTLACHTAIIAQSGSGKSYFLSRLIEELLLNTKARCIILDPNADFKKIYEVENNDLWVNASYDMHQRTGKLPHEKTRNDFKEQWSKISINIKSLSYRFESNEYLKDLSIDWPSVSIDFIAEDADPIIRNILYHCHVFTESIYLLTSIKNGEDHYSRKNFFKETERIYSVARALIGKDVSQAFNEFDESLLSNSNIDLYKNLDPDRRKSRLQFTIRRLKNRAQTAVKYMTEEVANFYFGKIQEFSATGILNTRYHDKNKSKTRLEVIDLPSISDKKTRLLVINSILSKEWEDAQQNWDIALENNIEEDERVPTFIIIDEAHNLIPSEPRNKAESTLREQFRTIIAEGRKYGLFLIIVSQRPDKLDPLVLSECDNKVIMKLSSNSVIDIIKKLLSLDGISNKLLEQTLNLEIGRGILMGKWVSNNPTPFFSAARRTIEGGRNLRDNFWAIPLKVKIPRKPLRQNKKLELSKIKSKKTTTKKKIPKPPIKKK